MGTTECYVNRVRGDTASVSSRVGRGWAKQPIDIATADLFPDHRSALAEYRRRRAAAGGGPGNYSS